MPLLTPCTEPGCPNPATGRGRCDDCRRAVDKRRGTSKQRGYDQAHKARRAADAPAVAAGAVHCWRCGNLIRPGTAWDEGHDDFDRSRYRGPEHASCNRATKARAGL